MGCGNSKLASGDADIQARVRPMLRRRIDDFRRRSHLRKTSTLSKKELLLAGEDCENAASSGNDSLGDKSHPSEGSEGYGKKIVPVLKDEEEEEEAKTMTECIKGRDEDGNGDGKEEQEKEIKQENRGHEPEEEEEEHDDSDLGRCISPGSPSFRYCLESLPHDTDDEEHESQVGSRKQNTETKEAENQASSESTEDIARSNTKARQHLRKIRRVIPKGGQVKNMLKVKSCYTPACSGHHHDKTNGTHLLQESAA